MQMLENDEGAKLPHPTGQLDLRARALLAAMDAVRWPKVSGSTVANARRDLRLMLESTSIPRPVARAHQAAIPGPKGPILPRIYTPIFKESIP